MVNIAPIVCLHLLCFVVLSVLSNFVIISLRKREMVAFLMYCDCQCSVGPTRSTVGLSAVCDCVIVWSLSLSF